MDETNYEESERSERSVRSQRNESESRRQLTSREFFKEAYENCFRYLNVSSLREAKEMTLGEYFLRMRAYILRQLDDQERAHYQAWLVARVFPAVDADSGEYVVQHLDEVFDRQKREAEIFSGRPTKEEQKSDAFKRLMRVKERQEAFRKRGGD